MVENGYGMFCLGGRQIVVKVMRVNLRYNPDGTTSLVSIIGFVASEALAGMSQETLNMEWKPEDIDLPASGN